MPLRSTAELREKYIGLVVGLHEPVGTGCGHVLFLERTDGQDIDCYDTFGRKATVPIAKLTLEKVLDHEYKFDEKTGHLLVRKPAEGENAKWKDIGPWKKFDPAYILPGKKPKSIRKSTKSGITLEDMGLD